MTDMPAVVTRFAPSPTGYLHIGGARTALFNWLYARANGGKFLLRIEDTDRARSTPEATAAILDAMAWLGLDADEDPVSQYARRDRHRAVAEEMLSKGTAYKCFSTPDEIAEAREAAEAAGKPTLFQSPWRDADPASYPDAPYAIRLKAPTEGAYTIKDKVQGAVTFQAETLDDMILLRSDGTPTYMLAVVVDDHDMGVTHIIRGDDHLINAGRQLLIYIANGWKAPHFAHIPLIHGEDGKKLSKRHGATGAEEYRAMGYMPEAMRNYLARLGWSHGNDELFTTEEAISWFTFKGLGKSPSRLDFKKLDNVSAHHIKTAPAADILAALKAYVADTKLQSLSDSDWTKLEAHMDILRDRSKKLPDILDKAAFMLGDEAPFPDDASLEKFHSVSNGILNELTARLADASWTASELQAVINGFVEEKGLKFGQVAQPIRIALSGGGASPSITEMMPILGQTETVARLEACLRSRST